MTGHKINFTLPPTKSMAIRELCFEPVGEQDVLILGTLECQEKASLKSKIVSNIRRWLVQEIPGTADGRGFQVSHPQHEQGSKYHVLISPIGPNRDTCDCAGGVYASVCVHRAAIRVIVSLFNAPSVDSGGVSPPNRTGTRKRAKTA